MSALCLQLVNDVKQNLPFKDDENKENVGANPIGVVQMEESLDKQMEKTKFGPKAVMKKGTLGNYEPNYKIKSGPGMLVSIYESGHGENCFFCICKIKDTDQLCSNHEADQHLCFCYTESTIPLLPTCKSKFSSL